MSQAQLGHPELMMVVMSQAQLGHPELIINNIAAVVEWPEIS